MEPMERKPKVTRATDLFAAHELNFRFKLVQASCEYKSGRPKYFVSAPSSEVPGANRALRARRAGRLAQSTLSFDCGPQYQKGLESSSGLTSAPQPVALRLPAPAASHLIFNSLQFIIPALAPASSKCEAERTRSRHCTIGLHRVPKRLSSARRPGGRHFMVELDGHLGRPVSRMASLPLTNSHSRLMLTLRGRGGGTKWSVFSHLVRLVLARDKDPKCVLKSQRGRGKDQ